MNDIATSNIARAANMNGGSKPDFSRIRTVDGLDVKGKRVLVRVDFNVPMQDGEVTDTTRITRVLPTLKQLVNGGAKVIVLTHLGRPKGQRSPRPRLRRSRPRSPSSWAARRCISSRIALATRRGVASMR